MTMTKLVDRNIRAVQQSLLEISVKGIYGIDLNQPEPIAGSCALHAWCVHSWGKWGHTPKIRSAPLSWAECPTIAASAMEASQDMRADIHPIVLTPHSQEPVSAKDFMYYKIRKAQKERGMLLHGAVLLGGPSGPINRKILKGVLLFSPSGRRLFQWNMTISGGAELPWHDGQAQVWPAMIRDWVWSTSNIRVRIAHLKRDPVLQSLLVQFPLPASEMSDLKKELQISIPVENTPTEKPVTA